MTFEHPTAAARQGDSVLPLVDWNTLNQVMLFEVSQVGRVVPRIAQIPFRDNAKRVDGRQRARVRSVQHVITVAIGDEFPLEAARQIQSRTPHADQLASCAQSDEDPRGVARLDAEIENTMNRWHPRPPAGRASLSTTHWSVILRAGEGGAGSAEALASLCDAYWYPLYAYARRRGYPVEDAQDLTQGFFARLLARDLLAKASSERGRFRAFLLTSFKHHLANEADAATARKRGGGQQLLSLDDAEARYEREPADHLTPEGLYERQWALTVIGKVLNELEREAEQDGKHPQFQELRLLLTDDEDTARTVAARLNMTEGAVRVAVHRLRRRFAELLRERIAETVESVEAIDDELRHLLEAVAPPPP